MAEVEADGKVDAGEPAAEQKGCTALAGAEKGLLLSVYAWFPGPLRHAWGARPNQVAGEAGSPGACSRANCLLPQRMLQCSCPLHPFLFHLRVLKEDCADCLGKGDFAQGHFFCTAMEENFVVPPQGN